MRLLFITLFLTSTLSQCTHAKERKPNILLILMDDLGYADVGFMPDAAKDIYTPNLDQLAQEGTIFTSAHVTHPFCGPSRTSIMTGRMPHALGAQYNLAAFSGNGITTSEKFISKAIDEAGYYTGIIGKWHLGEEEQFHPLSRGFDYFYGFLGGGHEYFSNTWIDPTSFNPSDYEAGNYPGNYNRPMMNGNEYIASDKGLYCTDVLTDAGIEFIDNASKDDQPFFLWMSYNAPHTPVQAMPSDIEELQKILGNNAATKNKRLTYTAMMYNVDYNIKRLIDQLKNSNQYDDTMIIFLSDNGGKPPAGANNKPLRGRKGDAYEGGHRVPMFIHWPKGGVQEGKITSYNFSTLDFYPTFAALTGAKIDDGKITEGINVWNDIVNLTDPRKDKPLFIMRQMNGINRTGVIKNNLKLYTWGNGDWQLYDLSKDIGETNDVSSKFKKEVETMKRSIYEWTWTQKKPAFFDSPSYKFEENWNKNNMPNFGKTFGQMYNHEDYISPIK
ncbi:sulfatase-like hydrolase/transferase [Reichenbachiella versicolor]|uniref:sulfatase-like hydrolase/transferase n=1 Tax=Reichenbachiella versicolor TaxID=1821036 RepID=UPI000D6E2FE6|nr:sulfatase-like hydrolase/transferase [Reichenbachiella versicolor]